MPRGEAVQGDVFVDGKEIDAGPGCRGAELLVQGADQAQGRVGHAVLVAADERQGDGEEGLLDDRAAERLLRGAPQVADAIHGLRNGGGVCRAADEVERVEGEEDDLGLEAVERRGRVHHRLEVLAVIDRVEIEPKPVAKGANTQAGQELLDRRGTEHGEADGAGFQALRRLGETAAQGPVQLKRLEEIEPRVGEADELLPDLEAGALLERRDARAPIGDRRKPRHLQRMGRRVHRLESW